MKDTVRENLVAFIYILGRDELPLGVITKLVKEIKGMHGHLLDPQEVDFSNKHLEAYAKEMVNILLEEECA